MLSLSCGMPLTDVKIRQTPPPDRGQITLTDDGIPGFGLRISQGGTKTFVLVHGRARSRTTIGRYPIISLSQARQRAREILAEITLGTHKPKSLTFQDAFELYKAHKLPQNRESTRRETERLLRKCAAQFRQHRLDDIHTPDIAAFLDRTTEKAHVFTALQTFFNWCVRRGYVEISPFGRLQKERAKPRDRALSPTELRSVLLAARQVGRYGQLIEFLILSGQRLGQAHALTEKHIHREAQTLSWPGSEMKTGRPHSIPYGPLTARLLETSLLPFTKTERYHSKLLVDSQTTHFTRHDLRRTFRTLHAQIGSPPHIAERLLSHTHGNPIQAVYDRHSYMPEMRQACEAYERFLSDLIASA
jgi:integrase